MVDPTRVAAGRYFTFKGALVRVARLGKPKLRSDGQYHRSVVWWLVLDPKGTEHFNRLGTFARSATERPAHD